MLVNILKLGALIIFVSISKMNNKLLSNQNTEVYKNYQRVLPFFKELVFESNNSISNYWSEEINGFKYICEASPSIINNLRHHCHHITGELPYEYRDHHNYNASKFKSKLELLNTLLDKDILVPEPNILGGFGHNINGKLINKDTLKYHESLIALEKYGLLNEINEINNPVICEIGAGWGGFTHCLSESINNSKFVIVPSLHESSSLVILEAIALKKIVIASNIKPFQEMSKVFKINIYDLKNYRNFEKVILKLKNTSTNKLRKYSDYNYKKLKSYSWDVIAQKYIDLAKILNHDRKKIRI